MGAEERFDVQLRLSDDLEWFLAELNAASVPEIIEDAVRSVFSAIYKQVEFAYVAGPREMDPNALLEISEFATNEAFAAILGMIKSQKENAKQYKLDRHNSRVAVYVKVPIPEELRWTILERDNFTCVHCGSRKFLSVGHIIAERKGGQMTPDNLQTECKSCNSKKGMREALAKAASNSDLPR